MISMEKFILDVGPNLPPGVSLEYIYVTDEIHIAKDGIRVGKISRKDIDNSTRHPTWILDLVEKALTAKEQSA
jgi:hypothetical protein